MNLTQELIHLVVELSYEKKQVMLASGRTSDFYIDMKNTLLHPRGVWLASTLILDKVREMNRGMKPTVKGVGGLTMGADPLSSGVSLLSQSTPEPLFSFYVRKEPKTHGTQQWIEGMRNFKQGDRVIILEDVVTTGGSTLKSVERAKLSGLEVVGVITAVDRQEGGRENIEKEDLPFHALITRSMILEASQ